MLTEGVAMDYMSSEDSGDDEQVMYRRPLPWLKQKYRKSLRQLDKIHHDSLLPRAKLMYRRRVDGEPSTRSHPDNAPEILLNVNLNTSINSNSDC